MKFADDFRKIARDVLTGKWSLAVGAALVASVLGGLNSEGVQINFNFDSSGPNATFDFAGQTIFSEEFLKSNLSEFFVGSFLYILIGLVSMAIVYFVLGSIIEVGYAKFNLNIVDREEADFKTLFAYFINWKTTAITRLLKSIYVLLWFLLLIVPGIIASYSYAMTGYILAENADMTATEAIDASKQMMYGNRMRLFCLHFSFIGWDILATLAFGIGHLWLTPYKQAAIAAFYREVSGTEHINEEADYTI